MIAVYYVAAAPIQSIQHVCMICLKTQCKIEIHSFLLSVHIFGCAPRYVYGDHIAETPKMNKLLRTHDEREHKLEMHHESRTL